VSQLSRLTTGRVVSFDVPAARRRLHTSPTAKALGGVVVYWSFPATGEGSDYMTAK